jgi:hypothetical protein
MKHLWRRIASECPQVLYFPLNDSTVHKFTNIINILAKHEIIYCFVDLYFDDITLMGKK